MRAQLLDATRPSDLVDLVDRLTLLQIDPTAAIAPNADLVAWSRLGASYQPADLTRALETGRSSNSGHSSGHECGCASRRRRRITRPMPPCGDGWMRTKASAAMSSPASATLDRCCPGTYRTPARCHGARAAGPTIATSPRCWSCSPQRGRSPLPDESDGNGSGTSLTASTPASSRCPPTKPNAAESSIGCVRSRIAGPRPPRCRESRSPWARPASPSR